MRSTASLLALVLPLAAQAPKPTAKKPAPRPAKAAEPKAASPVVARVGQSVITEADVEALIKSMPPQQQMQLQLMPNGRQEMVKRMAESKLIAEKARRMGLDQTADFQNLLRRTHEDLLARAYLQKVSEELQKKMAVTDEQVKAYYDAHADKFKTPETFDARHILVGNQPQGAEKARTPEEVAARVKEVQDALAKGATFESLVEKYTDDPGSKATGGLYTGVRKGQFVPEFEAAALKQELGKVGEPVKTQYGFHLIKVEKRTEAQTQAFEAVKDQAKQAATADRQNAVWDELMAGLKAEIKPFELVTPAPAAPAAAVAPAVPEVKK